MLRMHRYTFSVLTISEHREYGEKIFAISQIPRRLPLYVQQTSRERKEKKPESMSLLLVERKIRAV
jgi:hypothetical protein